MAACSAFWTNCVVVTGRVVGFDPPDSQTNCGLRSDPWRFYCTENDAAEGGLGCA